MHTEPVLDKRELGAAYREFMANVAAFLSPDKYAKFEQLVPAPLPTVELTDTIYSELVRVFEAQNSYFNFEFSTPELAADFDAYLETELEDNNFWRNQGFELMKTAVNCLIVVDLPREQTTPRPAPYYHPVGIERVKAIKNKRDGYCDFVIFENGPDELIILDDKYYRVLAKDVKGDFTQFTVEYEHLLGYTPAKSLWRTHLNDKDTTQRKGPITTSLGQLDKILFWEISIEYYNSYGVFPIYWSYKTKCNYQDEHGNTCENGHVTYDFLGETKVKPCPTCTANKAIGAGSFIKVPAPVEKGDPDLREPVGMLGVDIDALEFTENSLRRRKDNVYLSCVGRNGETSNNQAQNEKQISAAFESKLNVLLRIKENFEVIHKWTLETVARLRYGAAFKTATVNYGDKFYLKTESELAQEYELGKKSGLPMFSLSAIREQLDETRYRNNLEMKERRRFLAELEPYQDLTLLEITDLYQKAPALVNTQDLLLKLNFDSIVKQFERENGPITQFLPIEEFETRIYLIKNQLYGYTTKGTDTGPRVN